MTAFATPEQFSAAAKANIDVLVSLTNSSIARAERLVSLNVEAARRAIEENAASSKALFDARDVQELVKLQTALVEPNMSKVADYARSVYEIAAEGQRELAQVVESRIADMNKAFNVALEKAAKSAPAGAEPVFAAVKSAVAVANDAYENSSKVVKQVSDAAEANLTAATDATVEAVSKAASRKSA